MDNTERNTFWAVVSALLAFLLWNSSWEVVAQQFMMLGVWLSSIESCTKTRKELEIVGYPKEGYQDAKRLQIVQRKENQEETKMPLEIIQMRVTIFVVFVSFSLFLWLFYACPYTRELTFLICGLDIIFTGASMIVLTDRAFCFIFYKRFKRLTIYNWRYRLGLYRHINNPQPKTAKLGKSVIIGEIPKRKRVYYTVRVKKSRNVYEKVMYCGEMPCDKMKEHMLYEICGVRYIM